MNRGTPRDIAASIKARLLQISRTRREELQSVLMRYAIERLLYRLSRSDYRSRFVLKGASLFALWLGDVHRPTRDVDFLGCGSDEIEPTVTAFQAICRQFVEEDGLVFAAETVTGIAIRDEAKYAGMRITLRAMLGKAVIPLQLDIGFGDVITPKAIEAEFPTLLDSPKARLLTYPRETVVAEKCEAMIDLGFANSRLKDFYDLWYLATHFDFAGLLLCQAISATFERRGTAITTLPPLALTAAFYGDENKNKQWQAFCRKSGIVSQDALTLEQCAAVLQTFLLPPLQAAQKQTAFSAFWQHDTLAWQEQ